MSAPSDGALSASALRDFVAAEAALLDDGRFDEWLALFAEDGRYWVPLLGARQADPHSHNSIAYEDRLLLQLRVERLKNPRAHSQHPPSHCQHVLQRPVVEHVDAAAGTAVLRTPFIYVEARGEAQETLAGRYRHELVVVAGGLRIRQKRIDLLNAGRALPAIQLFI
jgi:3-phenylpropionate/cinnamic acid dioxygenase small subunit